MLLKPGETLARVLLALCDPKDLELLLALEAGAPREQAADFAGLGRSAAFKRLQRLKARLAALQPWLAHDLSQRHRGRGIRHYAKSGSGSRQ